MNMHFSREDAVEFGQEAALIIDHLVFMCDWYGSSGSHQMEGRSWAWMTLKALQEKYCWISTRTIQRAIERLIAGGVLLRATAPQRKILNEQSGRSTWTQENWFAFADQAEYLGRRRRGSRGDKVSSCTTPIVSSSKVPQTGTVDDANMARSCNESLYTPLYASDTAAAVTVEVRGVQDDAARAAAAAIAIALPDRDPGRDKAPEATLAPAAVLLCAAGFEAALAAELAGARGAEEVASLIALARGKRDPTGFLRWFLETGQPPPGSVAAEQAARVSRAREREYYAGIGGPRGEPSPEAKAEEAEARAEIAAMRARGAPRRSMSGASDARG